MNGHKIVQNTIHITTYKLYITLDYHYIIQIYSNLSHRVPSVRHLGGDTALSNSGLADHSPYEEDV